MTAREYMAKREELMARWEQECRQWLEYENRKNNNEYLDVNATFFKDGVIDPETWFDEKNTFRPLFILKEVNDQKPTGEKTFDFVAMDESDGHDIWNGIGHWKDFATLVFAMIQHIKFGKEIPPYEELRNALFEQKSKVRYEALKQIAVINVKKLSGGGKDTSEDSKKTMLFQDHAKKFSDNLLKEEIVDLIKPNIIIFLGTNINKYFKLKEDNFYGIPTVNGLHSSINPNCRRRKFYNETIERINNVIKERID